MMDRVAFSQRLETTHAFDAWLSNERIDSETGRNALRCALLKVSKSLATTPTRDADGSRRRFTTSPKDASFHFTVFTKVFGSVM